MKSSTVLIVEDDLKIATLVAKNLEAVGLVCHQVHDGNEVLSAIDKRNPDLLVLDVMLPGIDGIEVTRRLRRESEIPILMLTARSSDSDKVLGFEMGAADYLTKPFSTRELVARVRALLRRTKPKDTAKEIQAGELTVDPGLREARMANEAIELTTLEFDLLYFLVQRPGRVYTRDALLEQVWGEDRIVDTRSIDSLISRLRRKLEKDTSHPRYIQTVWGAGYRFAKQSP
ncbi:MAG: response regulator transcription factor [Candidatus Eisenbacteria bacterium]|uniref:Response regulator transcription factor n=1 Tax=Eiseniibacteriota bacterium TaxID=2212470 RepID=A0A7Y2E829_UNCEI|nr:response regulator transcription factor [Candidatus Eisenbacteria bacterium]